MPRVDRRQNDERGAAAVEFALVSFILFPLIFGLIDFGLWFNDSISARQGVREAARSGVVQSSTCGDPAVTGLDKVACAAHEQVAPVAGKAWVRVSVPTGWQARKPLVVCAQIKETGATGLTPLPGNGLISTETQMSIEVAAPPPAGASVTGSTIIDWPNTAAWGPPPGTWDFCG